MHRLACLVLAMVLLIVGDVAVNAAVEPMSSASEAMEAIDDSRPVVKVGVYELLRFHAFEADGNCTGYDIDYLNRIANVTGWRYEFVKVDSWAHAIDMLRAGQIDILSPSQITPSRLVEFGFSTFPIGKVYAAILSLNQNPVVYEDYAAFAKMTFGIEQGNTYLGIFQRYARKQNFTPNIKLYPNHNELVAALHRGEVDAIVANIMRAEDDMRLIGKAATVLYYYMYRKDDTFISEGLTHALDQIEKDEPGFQRELVHTYFPIYDSEPLSKVEVDYVNRLPEIKVAMPVDEFPFSFVDKKDKKLTGILVDYLKKAGDAAHINFVFEPMPENDSDLNEGFHLRVESGLSPIEKARRSSIYSNNIFDSQLVLVSSKDMHFQHGMKLNLGRASNNSIRHDVVSRNFPNIVWRKYKTTENCLDAIKRSEIDGCLLNQLALSWYLDKPEYESLILIPSASLAYSICLKTVSGDTNAYAEDSRFVKILNKSFKMVSPVETQEIIIRYTAGMPYKLSAWETLQKYWYVVVLMLLVMVWLFIYAQNRNYHAQRDGLTGLYNRGFAKSFVESELKSKRDAYGLFMIFDLDHFKQVNDTFGHQEGDRVLQETANILRQNCRKCDLACRLGGDEFIVYFPDMRCNEESEEVLLKLLKRLERTIVNDGNAVHISSCIGVVEAPVGGKNFTELYKHADQALYVCKSSGRNCIRYFEV